MWCQHCQQDVPGVVQDGQVRCIRCSTSMRADTARRQDVRSDWQAIAEHGLDLSAAPARPAMADLEWEDWDVESELRHVQRTLRSVATPGELPNTPSLPMTLGTKNSPEALQLPPWNLPLPQPTELVNQQKNSNPPKKISKLALLAITVGLLAFVGGAVLLGCSYLNGWERLWHLGLPLALGGQVGLLLGFVMQMDRLRQDNSQAVEKLATVNERLQELRQTTAQLSTTHSGPAQAFYAHMAEGASPHILLADLKGQLDLLAWRMSKS